MVVCGGVFSRPSSKCFDGGQRLLFVVLLSVLLVFPGLIALSRDTSIITNTRIALDRQSQDDVNKPRHEQVPLVTGCGPSGTMFVKELLEAHGIPALHEEMETGHVSVSWLYGAYHQSNIPFESEQSKALRTRFLKGGSQTVWPGCSPRPQPIGCDQQCVSVFLWEGRAQRAWYQKRSHVMGVF
mmetsp:Transcript_10674/g.21145  ORF Transcript_10674/g.21145 Transcript_10674/m.21145 type:complete len:184 (+) Transcript_10674:34-585(+)